MSTQDVMRKVQEILTRNLKDVGLRGSDTFTVRHGSSRAFVSIRGNDDWSFVKIAIPLLVGVTESPELYEFLAFHDEYIFGHLYLERWDDATAMMFVHNVGGDYLDEEELMRPLYGMLGVADEIDDELQKRFGGERFHEE